MKHPSLIFYNEKVKIALICQGKIHFYSSSHIKVRKLLQKVAKQIDFLKMTITKCCSREND